MVWLRDGAKSIRIAPRDIVWIASAGNYVEYTLADGASHLIRGTLAAAESELSRFNLARIHRTRLANLDRVTGMESKPSGDFELTFDTGQTVSGSRRYRDAVAALERSALKRPRERCASRSSGDRSELPIFQKLADAIRKPDSEPADRTKSLLFAPRPMLERAPQVHRAVRAPPSGAYHPFHEPLYPRESR